MAISTNDPGKWISVAQYDRSDESPVNIRWLIFHRREEMRQFGCLLKLGKRLLIDHDRLMLFLEDLDRRNEGIVPRH